MPRPVAPIIGIDIKTLPPRTIGPLTFSWAQPAGRLIWAVLLFVVIMAAIIFVAHRPKPIEPPTWAQCMAGAVFTFAVFLLGYAVIPHEWIVFAGSYLRWNASKFLVRSGQKICTRNGGVCTPVHWLNFDINLQAVNDAIAALIYVVMLGLNIYVFSIWQKRPTRAEAAAEATGEEKVVGTSAYGRPVTARS
jgi:hypothetical protein